jgi:hypothetical protein
MGGKQLRRDPRRVADRVTMRIDDGHLVAGSEHHVDIGKADITAGETEIDFLGTNQTNDPAGDDVFQDKRHPGVFLAKLADGIGQESGGERRQRRDPDHAAPLRRHLAQVEQNRIEVLQGSLEGRQQFPADPGKIDRSRRAVEQPQAQRLFQAPDLHRQRRLRQVKQRGGLGKTFQFCDRNKGAQLPDADIHSVCLFLRSNKFNCIMKGAARKLDKI